MDSIDALSCSCCREWRLKKDLEDKFAVSTVVICSFSEFTYGNFFSVSVSAEYLLVPQRYHREEEVPARHRSTSAAQMMMMMQASKHLYLPN